MVEVVYPQHLNHHGTLFGGEALRMMDTAAFVAATRRTRRTMVTVAVEPGERRRCGRGRFVFVAVDEHGRSVALHE